MKKNVADLLSELGDLISQQKLFLSALRQMGASNIWVQFYHLVDDTIKLIDVVMFDTAYGNLKNEIVNPNKLHRVLNVSVFKKKVYGRKTLALQFEVSGEIDECHLYFSDMAFHMTTVPVHRTEIP